MNKWRKILVLLCAITLAFSWGCGKKEEPAISCEICLHDIDPEEAETYEVEDYVHHFCGLECYSEWEKRKKQEEEKKD